MEPQKAVPAGAKDALGIPLVREVRGVCVFRAVASVE